MPSTSFAAAAAVVLATVRLAAAGSGSTLVIHNSCSQAVAINKCQNGDNWLDPVGPNDSSDPQSFDPTTSGGTGVSYKIYPQDNTDVTPMQFEYSAGGGDGQIWFDLSNIDGYPEMFVSGGVTVTPKGSGSNCKEILCPKGDRKCKDAYNVWDDDQKAMRNCDTGCEVELHLCSGGDKDSDSEDSGSGSGSGNGNGNGNGDGGGGYMPTPPPAPQYQPSSTLVTSASAPPPVQKEAESNNYKQDDQDNVVKVDSNGKAYVGDNQQAADTTVIVPAYETKVVMAPSRQKHRRHAHGHAHHHE